MNTIDDLANQMTFSIRRVNLLEIKLVGKISSDEYARLNAMYASPDVANHYLADLAVKSLKENL